MKSSLCIVACFFCLLITAGRAADLEITEFRAVKKLAMLKRLSWVGIYPFEDKTIRLTDLHLPNALTNHSVFLTNFQLDEVVDQLEMNPEATLRNHLA